MKILFTSLLFIFSLSLFAVNADQFIGMTPENLISKVGSPDQVLVERGGVQVEDDVIFFYNNRSYFYFNQSRLWQVRYDKKFSGDILNFKIGSTKDEIIESLGEPLKEDTFSITYKRPDRGYPVFLRIFLKNNKAEDIYFYRGDY